MQTIMINPPRAEYLPAVVSSPSVPPHLAGHHTLPPHLTPSTSPHLTPHPLPHLTPPTSPIPSTPPLTQSLFLFALQLTTSAHLPPV